MLFPLSLSRNYLLVVLHFLGICLTILGLNLTSVKDEDGIGKYFGKDVGVGLADGVRCKEGRPLGEDGQQYCKILTQEDLQKRKRNTKYLFIVTSSGKISDARQRFLRSVKTYSFKEPLDLDSNTNPSEEDLLRLLKETVKKISEKNPDGLILYIDGPDVILSAGPSRVVEEFEYAEAGILLSSDGLLRDEFALQDQFPKVERGRRFLDSGAFVANIKDLSAVFNEFPTEKSLQELMTKAYTKDKVRKSHRIKIDHMANLFQNLDGATAEVDLRFAGKEAYLQNTMYSTVPVVIRANGPTQSVLNRLGSYLARSWNPESGCLDCWEGMNSLDGLETSAMPVVILAIFVEKPTPYLEEFLHLIDRLNYPKERIHLYFHNSIPIHQDYLMGWFNDAQKSYKSSKFISPEEDKKKWHSKNAVMDLCLEDKECDFIFFLDSEGHIDNPFTLKLLIEQNRDVVAPLLPRPEVAWSNFWGALTSDGFYARSEDYMDIVHNNIRGLWNVPFIGTAFLVKRSIIENPETKPTFINNLMEPDTAFCQNLREKGVFMYVTNRVDFGHLVNAEDFVPDKVNAELWTMFTNRYNWEKRYLHPNYSNALNESTKLDMPCPDVFWFPVYSERFTKELIEVMETYGRWSDGSHDDPRLSGGYESVPTVDVHMNQVGYEKEWLELLRLYIQPLQLKAFAEYYNDVGPPRALMNFVVRYRPEEQPFLRPHHDTATYTINLALNRPKIDFQGGGVRFLRYDCSVLDTRVGWILMHPGRLTHLHEGLRVTGGTRYIAVSFIDP